MNRKLDTWRRFEAFNIVIALALTALITSAAVAQLAPSGEHYAGRPSDTGYGGSEVDATGNFPANITLDLPPVRAGLPLPLQIVYVPHRVGAAGLAWDVPLSYVQQDATFAHRRPASAADAAPVPRRRTTLSLLGQSADLIQKGDEWIARVGTLELIVRKDGSLWHAYDGQGRTYTFEQPNGLPGASIWLLKSISAAGGSTVSLLYDVANVPINGDTATAINLVRVSYNTYPALNLQGVSCAKTEIALSYVTPATTPGYSPIVSVNSLPPPLSMSIFDDKVMVRTTRLDQIDVKSRSSCAMAPERLRRYVFKYAPDADTGLTQLASVSMLGRQGTQEETTALPVSSYQYGSALSNNVLRYARTPNIKMPAGIAKNQISSTSINSVSSPESGQGYAMWQTLQDFDGDGKADLVFQKDNKLWIAKGSVTRDDSMVFGFGPQALVQLSDSTLSKGAISTQTMSTRRFNYQSLNRNTGDTWRTAIDVNGDGRIDVVDAAEEAGHWVVYLNTPNGASGIKWERRSYSITSLLTALRTVGHTINGNYLPLSRQSTGTTLLEDECLRWDGKQWQWTSPGYLNRKGCPMTDHIYKEGAEATYLEWDFRDLNGDGYPDFVFDTAPADFRIVPPALNYKPKVGATIPVPERWVEFRVPALNELHAALNVVGVRFDNDSSAFSEPFKLTFSDGHAISEWTCNAGLDNPCPQPYQIQSAALADINGDGLLDRVIGARAMLGTYSGVGSAFSAAYIDLPGSFASQASDAQQCKIFGVGHAPPTATQVQGLRDLTGDGIPDYYEGTPSVYQPPVGYTKFPRVWIGTGSGFRPPVEISSLNANFQFSHETESCDGKFSQTDGGLYDIDGDGKPEIVSLDGDNFVISHLVGGRVFGTPESGRLTGVDNGYGAKTTVTYISAKQYDFNPLPFPEIVVNSVATRGAYNLGGNIDGTSFAYGKGELVFDSAQDRFEFPGYQRQVAMRLLKTPGYTKPPVQNKSANTTIGGGLIVGEKTSGTPTITDAWPLSPFSNGLTQQQRWLRERIVGMPRDVLTLRSSDITDPWLLLNIQATDKSVIGEITYDWDAKLYETPLTPPVNPIDCFDIVDPLDFQETIASLNANSVDVCRAHGFPYQTTTTTWRGDAAPPSDKNVQTRTNALSVDDFGRPLITEYDNDVFRSDDDYCISTSFAAPVSEYPRVLTALSSRRASLCGEVYGYPLASESWSYDHLPAGSVSDGHITSHNVDQRASDTGALLNTYQDYAATYDAGGDISTVSTQRDDAIRTVTFKYDVFGIIPTHVNQDATGIPSTAAVISYDPISSLPLISTDPNNTQRGIDYDGFGRPVRSTVTPPNGSMGVLATAAYVGFDGADPHGRRIQLTEFPDPTSLAGTATSAGQSSTGYLDELGRRYRTDVSLGHDYADESLIAHWSVFDGAGRLAFFADTFPANQMASNAYGRSFFYKDTGDLDCVITGHGHMNALDNATDVAAERLPICFQRSFDGHVDTLDVRDAGSLQADSPQSGVIKRTVRTAVGRTIERSTLKAGVRIEDAQFGFDRLGQGTSMSRFLDPANAHEAVVWSTHLDSLGHILQLSEPATATRSYTYSVWGEPLKTEWTDDSTKHSLISTYDSASRLLSSHEENNGLVDPATVNTYTYDTPVNPSSMVKPTFVLGQLASAASASGAVALSYDPFGHVNARAFTDSKGRVYIDRPAYHSDGSLASLTFNLPDNAYAPELVKYGYDSARRIRTINFSDGTGARTLYSAANVDMFGRTTAAKYGGVTSYNSKFAEDGRRLVKQIAIGSPAGSRRIVYGQFDPMTRELSREEISDNAATGERTSLSYDALGRLATKNQTKGSSTISNWRFSYDALGNARQLFDTTADTATRLSYDHADKDRLCHIGYANNLLGVWLNGLDVYLPTSCNVSYDATGSVLKEQLRNGTRELSYFSSGDVRSIIQQDKKASFTYDAFGQLQTLDTQSGNRPDRHDFHYGHLIERHDLSSDASSSFITRNIPGPNGIVASRRGHANDWVYGFGELRGNRFAVDQDGKFIQSIDYQPFGKPTSTGAAPGTLDYTDYQWNGGDELADFGLSHLGARIYDPEIGRFLSRDPLLIPRTAASSNPYAFAENDPWNNADPDGADPGDEETGASDCADIECDGFGAGAVSHASSPTGISGKAAPTSSAPNTSPEIKSLSTRFGTYFALGFVPRSFDFDAFTANGGTVNQAIERVKNFNSPEEDEYYGFRNAQIDREENYVRIAGLTPFAILTGGAALLDGVALAGTALYATGFVDAAAFMGVGAEGTAALGGTALITNEVNELDEEAEGTEVYSVAYQARLPPSSYVGKRSAHFREANELLLRDLESDPDLKQNMNDYLINLQRTPTGLAPDKAPAGWTWHHAPEPGIMELVPRIQHQKWFSLLHPNGNGGYDIWGK